jgi:hypothetical protein
MRNMEVPPPGALGLLARRSLAPNPASIRDALSHQIALLRGLGKPSQEPCRPPLPGCHSLPSASPGAIQQLQGEVAALKEQVARLTRMSRSPGLQSNPFVPQLVSGPPPGQSAATFRHAWAQELLRPQTMDTASMELAARAHHMLQTKRQRQAISALRVSVPKLALLA